MPSLGKFGISRILLLRSIIASLLYMFILQNFFRFDGLPDDDRPKLGQRCRFDLTNPFPGQSKYFADLFQGLRFSAIQSESLLNNPAFILLEGLKPPQDLLTAFDPFGTLGG